MPAPTSRLGLALSGGGYRATAFHLGTFKKLDELGILSAVAVMSTISGGSITGAAWCLSDKDYIAFHNEMVAKLQRSNVVKWILTSFTFYRFALVVLIFLVSAVYLLFTSLAPLSLLVFALLFVLFFKFQYVLFPVSEEIERAYDQFFFAKKKLGNLNKDPILAIGSSNLETGRPFTFSKTKMSDSTYAQYDPPIHFDTSDFPVSRAVMASSCVPFAFSPIRIKKDFFKLPSDFDRVHPQLVDGGVYDNQGLQKITQNQSSYECQDIIVSDAGGNFFADKKYPNVISLLIRTVDLFMFRIKTGQMTAHIYRNVQGDGKPIAYFSLGWKLVHCIPGFINNMIQGLVLPSVIQAHGFDPAWIEKPAAFKTEIQQKLEVNVGYASIFQRNLTDDQWDLARTTGTNLTPLSAKKIEYLIQHAENLTELQVKLYCPHLL